jgi:hypothetical protein
MSGEGVVADETARERLVSAAISAFAAKGFHGTTTSSLLSLGIDVSRWYRDSGHRIYSYYYG